MSRAPAFFILLCAAGACSPSAATAPMPAADSGAENGDVDAAIPVVSVAPTRFVAIAALKTKRMVHTATLLPDGRVLIAGGETASGEMIADAEVYAPADRAFARVAPMLEARSLHTATLLGDGRVLVVGGGRSNQIVAPSGVDVRPDALLYDPSTNAWTRTPKLHVPRHGHTATPLADGSVLVVGGARDESVVGPILGGPATDKYGKAVAEAEIYEPATNTWRDAGAMSARRFLHTATRLADGRVLVAGGGTEENELSLKTAEIYDPKTGAWSKTGSFAGEDRLFHAAEILPSGAVLVVGGKQSNVKFLASTERYDPASGTWTAAAPREVPGIVPRLASLADGRVLVLGGNECTASGCGALSSAQIYDEKTAVWSKFPALGTARVLHTATRLPSGEVLVAGGGNGTSALVESSELATSPAD